MKKILKKIVNNKMVQAYVKARVSKTTLAIIVFVLTSLGLLGVSDVTNEQAVSYVKEFGGSAIMQPFQEDVVETGLIEEEVELPDAGVQPYSPTIDLPSWSDVKDNSIYKRTRDQEYGTCVYESYDILYIESLIYQDLLPVEYEGETFLDIDHAYFDKEYQPGVDSGTIPSQAYNEAVEEGLPIRLSYQDVDSDNTRFSDDLANKNDLVYNYRVKAPFAQIARGYGADSFFRAYEAELAKGNRPLFRISKRNHRNVAWYHETTPFIKSPVKELSGTGHSMAGGSAYGIFEYRGEPAVYIHESAGSVRYHLARLSILRMVMTGWELYEVTDAGTNIIEQTLIVEKDDALLTDTIRFGQRGDSVTALQEYLIEDGRSIPAGATGFFGGQTRTALNAWQDFHFGNLYDGTVWGSISRERYNLLQQQ